MQFACHSRLHIELHQISGESDRQHTFHTCHTYNLTTQIRIGLPPVSYQYYWSSSLPLAYYQLTISLPYRLRNKKQFAFKSQLVLTATRCVHTPSTVSCRYRLSMTDIWIATFQISFWIPFIWRAHSATPTLTTICGWAFFRCTQ